MSVVFTSACFVVFFLPLLLSFVYPVESTYTIEPNTFVADFANKLDSHTTWLTVGKQVAEPPVLYIDNVIEPYDRIPPVENALRICSRNRGSVVRDWSRQEEYTYACCRSVNRTKTSTGASSAFACPVPSPPPPSLLLALLYTRSCTVYVSNNTVWDVADTRISYADSNDAGGVIKRIIAVFVIATLVGGVLITTMGFLHAWSNEHPRLFILLHVLSTVSLVLLQVFFLKVSDNTVRGSYIRAGVTHAFINTLYGPLLVYIPTTNERKFNVKRGTSCGTVAAIAHHRVVRRACVYVYFVGMLLEVLATYSIVEILWAYFEVSAEIIIAGCLLYLLATLIYLTAFLTAIYEVHVPLRLGANCDDDRRNGNRNRDTFRMELYKPDNGMFVRVKSFPAGSVVAADWESCGKSRVWMVGKMDGDTPLFEKGRTVTIPTSTRVRLVVFAVNERGDLERIGSLKSREINEVYRYRSDHFFTLWLLRFALRVAPTFDSSKGRYQLNIVDILRDEMHALTARCGRTKRRMRFCGGQPWYALYYWFVFVAITTAAFYLIITRMVCESVATWVYACDIVILVVMTVFTVNVSTAVWPTTKRAVKRRGVVPLKEEPNHELPDSTKFSVEPAIHYAVDSAVETIVLPTGTFGVTIRGTAENVRLTEHDTARPMLVCKRGHTMRCTRTDDREWTCDASVHGHLDALLPANADVWFCDECNYCACSACIPNVRAESKKAPATLRLEKAKCTVTLQRVAF